MQFNPIGTHSNADYTAAKRIGHLEPLGRQEAAIYHMAVTWF